MAACLVASQRYLPTCSLVQSKLLRIAIYTFRLTLRRRYKVQLNSSKPTPQPHKAS